MKTVLIVEDDDSYRKMLYEELLSEGYHPLTAANGKVAIDMVQNKQIDLILLDLLMPELDGTDFYYQLKHKLKKKIPIIILTNVTTAAAYDHDIVKDVMIKADVSLEKLTTRIKELV